MYIFPLLDVLTRNPRSRPTLRSDSCGTGGIPAEASPFSTFARAKRTDVSVALLQGRCFLPAWILTGAELVRRATGSTRRIGDLFPLCRGRLAGQTFVVAPGARTRQPPLYRSPARPRPCWGASMWVAALSRTPPDN